MKTPAFILALTAAAAYFGLRRAEVPPGEVDAAGLHEGSLTIQTAPADVFRRALWRRPGSDDKILHAEQREWTKNSADGVAHWQWFLAVEPGAALKKWLREQNPFSVHPAGKGAAPVIERAPGWFPGDLSAYEMQTGGNAGSLVFLFSRQGETLYITNSGAGFTPGAAEPARPAPGPKTVSTGRLPLTPPPISKTP